MFLTGPSVSPATLAPNSSASPKSRAPLAMLVVERGLEAGDEAAAALDIAREAVALRIGQEGRIGDGDQLVAIERRVVEDQVGQQVERQPRFDQRVVETELVPLGALAVVGVPAAQRRRSDRAARSRRSARASPARLRGSACSAKVSAIGGSQRLSCTLPLNLVNQGLRPCAMPSIIHMRISSGDCTESFQRHFSSTEVEVTRPIGLLADGTMAPVWNFFGYDEPNYTYAPNGKKLLGEVAALSPAPVYVRVHNLFTSGDGSASLKWGSTNVYTEDASGKPVYDWTILDRIFDTFHATGIKPLVELGFMPEALSTHPEPYRHNFPQNSVSTIYTGWAYPPKDYRKWSELVVQFVRHLRERYGDAEVQTWLWEVWNEPDIGYWQGTPEEYFKLYDFSVRRNLAGASRSEGRRPRQHRACLSEGRGIPTVVP